jgi:hypothetical protein
MDGVKNLLVFEDDAYLRSGSVEKLLKFLEEVPDDWDQLMLGGQHLKQPKKVKPGIEQCVDCQRTHAYAIRGQFLRDLYTAWTSPDSRHCDWIMGPLQASRKVYAPDPFVFGQEASRSDINGRVNPRKSWDRPDPMAPVILLHAPRRVVEELREHGLHIGYDRDTSTGIDNGLIKVFDSENVHAKLRKWIQDIQWECAADEGLVCTVWHPKVNMPLLKKCCDGTVFEVRGETTEEVLKQLPPILCRTPRPDMVVLLKAPRQVVSELRGLGWHTGHWRDPLSDIDNGLRKIFATNEDRLGFLKEWVEVVGAEIADRRGVLTVWHPDATLAELQQATSKRVVEIAGESVSEVLAKWEALE